MPAIAPYETKSGIKSAERVLRVFELFHERKCPLRVTEISRELDMPQSSTSFLLRSMPDQGYLIYQNETRKYFPSLRLPMIAEWIQYARLPETGPEHEMNELAERFHHTVCLAVRKDLYYETIAVIPARSDLRYVIKPRELRPLSRTTIGHLLLSAHDDGYVGRLLRRTNSLETDPARHLSVDTELGAIRALRPSGFAHTESHAVLGVGVMAVLIRQPRIEENLVLGLVAPVEAMRPTADEAAAALLAARERLTPVKLDEAS